MQTMRTAKRCRLTARLPSPDNRRGKDHGPDHRHRMRVRLVPVFGPVFAVPVATRAGGLCPPALFQWTGDSRRVDALRACRGRRVARLDDKSAHRRHVASGAGAAGHRLGRAWGGGPCGDGVDRHGVAGGDRRDTVDRRYGCLPAWCGMRPFKIFLGRATRPLRWFLAGRHVGLGGTSSFSGLLDEWANPWRPGQVLLGASLFDPKWIVGFSDDRHVCTIATNRAGKGRSVIIPNLLTWRGSVLVIDPKGQNALVTAMARGK